MRYLHRRTSSVATDIKQRLNRPPECRWQQRWQGILHIHNDSLIWMLRARLVAWRVIIQRISSTLPGNRGTTRSGSSPRQHSVVFAVLLLGLVSVWCFFSSHQCSTLSCFICTYVFNVGWGVPVVSNGSSRSVCCSLRGEGRYDQEHMVQVQTHTLALNPFTKVFHGQSTVLSRRRHSID